MSVNNNVITVDGYNNSKSKHNEEFVVIPRDSAGKQKCLREVPTILLEYDRRYGIVQKDSIRPYYSNIAVCCNGYKLHPYETNLCVPDCGDNCKNGFCVNTNECQCFSGYSKNEHGICVLMCPVECQNGRCKRDGSCECNAGYTIGYTGEFCIPICNDGCGLNQYCKAPEICGCQKGFHLRSGGCEPECTPDCFLGRCVAPNVCLCDAPYSDQNYEKRNGICQHRCYQKCENGKCIGKNRCVCYDGFEYDERTQSCIPDAEGKKTFRFE